MAGLSFVFLASGSRSQDADKAPTSSLHSNSLASARSLAAELAAALASKRPLVVMVSLDGCPWCKLVRDNYLAPMRREGLVVVQVDMRSKQPLLDFAGAARTHDDLVRSWKVKSAPTLLFFGPGPAEVAPRLTGASNDFYGAYLDERLLQATRAVTPG
jgi:thioredoxin-related protein